MHILGLVHERRANQAWQELMEKTNIYRESLLAAARGHEADAVEFFRKVRELRPYTEHGYVSEAVYFKNKARVLEDSRANDVEAERQEISLQLHDALALLLIAQTVIPKESQEYLPTTKVDVLRTLGELNIARENLERLLEQEEDPVRLSRLQRSAATICAAQEDWIVCGELCKKLIDSSEHDAGLYLLLDRALWRSQSSLRERKQWLQESVRTWNKNDISTLVRYAIINCYLDDFREALRILQLATNVVSQRLNAQDRERIRHVLKETQSSNNRRFTGQVDRMWKTFEGQISSPDLPEPIFFRVAKQDQDQVQVNTEVTFSLAIRVRGFRAIEVETCCFL